VRADKLHKRNLPAEVECGDQPVVPASDLEAHAITIEHLGFRSAASEAGPVAYRFGDCASRRIRRSHTPRDLGTALTLDDSNVVLALQI
jgi:hypothetical protein